MSKIENILVSVSDTRGLCEFLNAFKADATVYATKGTRAFLEKHGILATDIAQLTGKSSLLDGLVKTLHPAIHAGILARRDDPTHMKELQASGWKKIDMVVVNFYPVEKFMKEGNLELIDIGGPTLIRAAAKNHPWCVPVPHSSWYGLIAAEYKEKGEIGIGLRRDLAADALTRTACYDAKLARRLHGGAGFGDRFALGLSGCLDLRYGENPHQKAAYFFDNGKPRLRLIRGELSFNNILDIDCCLAQLSEFDGNAAVVVKHVSPCGIAEHQSPPEALRLAYECDPMSAFGGVIGTNFRFDVDCARFMAKKFVECIVAPDFEDAALKILSKKKRTRLVAAVPAILDEVLVRSACGGLLVQEADRKLLVDEIRCVTGSLPNQDVMREIEFAWKVVKHVKSNAIVVAKEKRAIGIGGGQPSRIDAARLAIRKAKEAGHDPSGGVMASDGFFPFPDCIELAHSEQIEYVVQPGGSIRDEEVIGKARELGITMLVTSTRHFRH